MKHLLIFIYILVEKQHRYIFDNIYFAKGDIKYKPITIYKQIRICIYNIVSYLFPTF